MTSLLGLARRALAMPPHHAVRAAVELAAVKLAGGRRRLADVLGTDPMDEGRVLAALGREEEPGAFAAGLFRGPDVVLPLAVPDDVVRDATRAAAVVAGARQAIEHRFDLLGSGPVRVDYGLRAPGLAGHRYEMAPGGADARRQRQRMESLLPGVTSGHGAGERYDPIDWHVDFISGYRWKPRQWYSSVPYGHVPGADVKVPWELSRLQHAGVLGLAWRLDPESPDGRAAPGEFVAQVTDWITANPVRRGVNWAIAMDAALRAYSWLTGLALLDGAPALTPAFRWLVYRSLLVHGEHIEANLEYHVHRGNHYLANVLGLVALGAALPDAPRADRWLAFGLQELVREMERQVLPDGADYEGSTAYHGFVAEMFLCATAIAVRLPAARRRRLADLPGTAMDNPVAPALADPGRRGFHPERPELFPAAYWDRLRRMAGLVMDMTKPDGRFAQVGDNDSGRVLRLRLPDDPLDWRQVPAVLGRMLDDDALTAAGADHALQAELLVPRPLPEPTGAVQAAATAGATRRPEGGTRRFYPDGTMRHGHLVHYPDTGLCFVRAGPLHLTLTCVTVSEGNLGGHVHNDLLSFEAQWDGADFVTDGGAYVYTSMPAARNAFRSTIAHSTVVVEGVEQRGWPPAAVGLFQVTRDADVRVETVTADTFEAVAAYGGVRHRRRWTWAADRVTVHDWVEAGGPATWRLNLAPDVVVADLRTAGEAGVVVLERDGPRCEVRLEGTGLPDVVEGCYSRGYGRRVPTVALAARLTGAHCRAELVFSRAGRTS